MLRGGIVLESGPVNQTVRIKGVVDVLATLRMKGKADLGRTRFNAVLGDADLCHRFTVFLGQVFKHFLAAWWHLGIELEGLEMNFHRDAVAYIFKCDFKAAESDRAPWARDIRDVVDFDYHVLSEYEVAETWWMLRSAPALISFNTIPAEKLIVTIEAES
jgi:hypothetical protein